MQLHFAKAPGNEVWAYWATPVSWNTNSFIVFMVLLFIIGVPSPFSSVLPRLFHCPIPALKPAVHLGHFNRPSFPRKQKKARPKTSLGDNAPGFVGFFLRKSVAQHLLPDPNQWELSTEENKIRTPIYTRFDNRSMLYVTDFILFVLKLKQTRRLLCFPVFQTQIGVAIYSCTLHGCWDIFIQHLNYYIMFWHIVTDSPLEPEYTNEHLGGISWLLRHSSS